MHCSVILSPEEFKKIHNAACDIDYVARALEDVIKAEQLQRLLKARDEIRKGLKSAYEQEAHDWKEKNTNYESFAKAKGLKTTWSMYEVSSLDGNHPYGEVSAVIYNTWESSPTRHTINGARWSDLYEAADAAIRASGDTHHIFIENFSIIEVDGERLLEVHTGS